MFRRTVLYASLYSTQLVFGCQLLIYEICGKVYKNEALQPK